MAPVGNGDAVELLRTIAMNFEGTAVGVHLIVGCPR